nr:toll/interleukin-1 receptor domain-containing protein [Candidatus Sigynarchaeota archaeon]
MDPDEKKGIVYCSTFLITVVICVSLGYPTGMYIFTIFVIIISSFAAQTAIMKKFGTTLQMTRRIKTLKQKTQGRNFELDDTKVTRAYKNNKVLIAIINISFVSWSVNILCLFFFLNYAGFGLWSFAFPLFYLLTCIGLFVMNIPLAQNALIRIFKERVNVVRDLKTTLVITLLAVCSFVILSCVLSTAQYYAFQDTPACLRFSIDSLFYSFQPAGEYSSTCYVRIFVYTHLPYAIFFYAGLVMYVISIFYWIRSVKLLENAGFVDFIRPQDYCMYITRKWEPVGVVSLHEIAKEFNAVPTLAERRLITWTQLGLLNAEYVPRQYLLQFTKANRNKTSSSITAVQGIESPFPAYQGLEPFIFVSYAHADSARVYPILTSLHDAGVRIWYDQGIPPADDFINTIAYRIKNCTFFIAFLTAAAIEPIGSGRKFFMRAIIKRKF